VRQLEAIQTNGTATVFGTVGTNQNFVGSGDFNGNGISDLLINVDDPATGNRAFFVDEIMIPAAGLIQHLIAVRGATWIVDGIGDAAKEPRGGPLQRRARAVATSPLYLASRSRASASNKGGGRLQSAKSERLVRGDEREAAFCCYRGAIPASAATSEGVRLRAVANSPTQRARSRKCRRS
jgi:hypothetical protein